MPVVLDQRDVPRDSWRVVEGRPDFADHRFGVTEAARHPPYVYGTQHNACLVHRVERVELHWYAIDYNRLVRLDAPVAFAHTACHQSFRVTPLRSARRVEQGRGATCAVPRPDALLCGRCHGEPATFGPRGEGTKAGLTRRAAGERLGCIIEGEEVEP